MRERPSSSNEFESGIDPQMPVLEIDDAGANVAARRGIANPKRYATSRLGVSSNRMLLMIFSKSEELREQSYSKD